MRSVAVDFENPRVKDIKVRLAEGKIGGEMHQFITDLYPICRSLTGNGVRETLHLIGQHIPLTITRGG